MTQEFGFFFFLFLVLVNVFDFVFVFGFFFLWRDTDCVFLCVLVSELVVPYDISRRWSMHKEGRLTFRNVFFLKFYRQTLQK
jgi:hypothetical protein